MPLSHGFHAVADGDLALVVTHLEMLSPPSAANRPEPEGLTVDRVLEPDPAANRALYRRIGTDWLWFSRLRQDDAALLATLRDPAYEVYELRRDGGAIGLLELDLRNLPDVEIVFFGLVPEAIGGGGGRFLMTRALALAWRAGVGRVWLHTCTADHPGALSFYRRSGFVAYRREIEITRDPRLDGTMDEAAASHMPLIGS
ncbi:MAG: GNAT family N-acetyltransferase [Flavobacteriaceae bacterium]